MTPQEVRKYYVTYKKFHDTTGMSPTSLGNWLTQGFIPSDSQWILQGKSGGDLKHGEPTK